MPFSTTTTRDVGSITSGLKSWWRAMPVPLVRSRRKIVMHLRSFPCLLSTRIHRKPVIALSLVRQFIYLMSKRFLNKCYQYFHIYYILPTFDRQDQVKSQISPKPLMWVRRKRPQPRLSFRGGASSFTVTVVSEVLSPSPACRSSRCVLSPVVPAAFFRRLPDLRLVVAELVGAAAAASDGPFLLFLRGVDGLATVRLLSAREAAAAVRALTRSARRVVVILGVAVLGWTTSLLPEISPAVCPPVAAVTSCCS